MHSLTGTTAWPDGLRVVTVCVGDDDERWREALRERDIEETPEWVSVRVDEDEAGHLSKILGQRGSSLLLLDPDGRVLRSNLAPMTLMPALAATLPTSEMP